MVVFKRHDDEGVTLDDMVTLDAVLESCPNLVSLDVNGFPPALGLTHPLPDSLRSLEPPLTSLKTFRMRCEMKVDSFKYLWARAPHLTKFYAMSVGGISDSLMPGRTYR